MATYNCTFHSSEQGSRAAAMALADSGSGSGSTSAPAQQQQQQQQQQQPQQQANAGRSGSGGLDVASLVLLLDAASEGAVPAEAVADTIRGNVGAADPMGRTALHYAAREGSVEACEALLAAGGRWALAVGASRGQGRGHCHAPEESGGACSAARRRLAAGVGALRHTRSALEGREEGAQEAAAKEEQSEMVVLGAFAWALPSSNGRLLRRSTAHHAQRTFTAPLPPLSRGPSGRGARTRRHAYPQRGAARARPRHRAPLRAGGAGCGGFSGRVRSHSAAQVGASHRLPAGSGAGGLLARWARRAVGRVQRAKRGGWVADAPPVLQQLPSP